MESEVFGNIHVISYYINDSHSNDYRNVINSASIHVDISFCVSIHFWKETHAGFLIKTSPGPSIPECDFMTDHMRNLVFRTSQQF